MQTDGSYQAGEKDKGILTLVGNVYQLKEKNGTVIVFRTDGQLDYVQDTNGYRITATYTNNQLTKLSDSSGEYFNLTYNPQGRINKITDSSGQATNYTYDQLGRRTAVATVDRTWNYTYDLAGQLKGAVFTSTNPSIPSQNLTYGYDAAGNRTQTIINGVTENYTTSNLNQYQNTGTTTYSYDLDGNLISKTKGSQTWTYSYDDNNRLVRVVDSSNNITQYEYDAWGNRSATIYNGQRTEYLIDPFGYGDVLAEYNSSGNLVARYTHGLGLVN